MGDVNIHPLYLIKFDDTEVPDETIFGAEIASKRFEQISRNWNAHLFVKVASNSRDDVCSGSNARLASDYDALAAQRDEGLARETELRSALQGMLEYFPEGYSDGEHFSIETAKAALAFPGRADGEKAPTPAVNLPRRKVKTEYSTAEEDAQADAWNAALDAVEELNK